jgi:hypothetical protein
MQRKTISPLPRELSEFTADLWLSIGTIRTNEYGHENTYYVDQFGHEFFCKNYPAQNRGAI